MPYKYKGREKEYRREYYLKNTGKNKECYKQYYLENKDKIKECYKQYYLENSEKIKEHSRQYWINNPEKIKQWITNNPEYKKQYRIDNCEELKEKQKQWVKNNPDKIKEISKRYYINNCKKVNEYARQYTNKKYKTDLKFNLNYRMTTAINKSLKGNKNGRHWESLVGYIKTDLIKRLQKTMPKSYNWKDFLSGELHIDHIIPRSVFNFTKSEHIDFKKCWALDNLRLLPAKENIIKSNKLLKPFQPALAI